MVHSNSGSGLSITFSSKETLDGPCETHYVVVICVDLFGERTRDTRNLFAGEIYCPENALWRFFVGKDHVAQHPALRGRSFLDPRFHGRGKFAAAGERSNRLLLRHANMDFLTAKKKCPRFLVGGN